MTEGRRKDALNACEKFFIESKWNFHTGLVTDLWLAAIEWADNNPEFNCSTTGLGGIPIGSIKHVGSKKKVRRVPTENNTNN